MNLVLQKIWYASENRANSRTKFVVMDDTGAISVGANQVEFNGKKHNFILRDPFTISRSRPKIAWKAYLLIGIVFLPIIVLMPMVLLAYAAGVFWGALIASSMPWVLVEGKDDNGNTQKAYFASGALMGWSKTNTHRLYKQLTSKNA